VPGSLGEFHFNGQVWNTGPLDGGQAPEHQFSRLEDRAPEHQDQKVEYRLLNTRTKGFRRGL
jgi:hypothetical protein